MSGISEPSPEKFELQPLSGTQKKETQQSQKVSSVFKVTTGELGEPRQSFSSKAAEAILSSVEDIRHISQRSLVPSPILTAIQRIGAAAAALGNRVSSATCRIDLTAIFGIKSILDSLGFLVEGSTLILSAIGLSRAKEELTILRQKVEKAPDTEKQTLTTEMERLNLRIQEEEKRISERSVVFSGRYIQAGLRLADLLRTTGTAPTARGSTDLGIALTDALFISSVLSAAHRAHKAKQLVSKHEQLMDKLEQPLAHALSPEMNAARRHSFVKFAEGIMGQIAKIDARGTDPEENAINLIEQLKSHGMWEAICHKLAANLAKDKDEVLETDIAAIKKELHAVNIERWFDLYDELDSLTMMSTESLNKSPIFQAHLDYVSYLEKQFSATCSQVFLDKHLMIHNIFKMRKTSSFAILALTAIVAAIVIASHHGAFSIFDLSSLHKSALGFGVTGLGTFLLAAMGSEYLRRTHPNTFNTFRDMTQMKHALLSIPLLFNKVRLIFLEMHNDILKDLIAENKSHPAWDVNPLYDEEKEWRQSAAYDEKQPLIPKSELEEKQIKAQEKVEKLKQRIAEQEENMENYRKKIEDAGFKDFELKEWSQTTNGTPPYSDIIAEGMNQMASFSILDQNVCDALGVNVDPLHPEETAAQVRKVLAMGSDELQDSVKKWYREEKRERQLRANLAEGA